MYKPSQRAFAREGVGYDYPSHYEQRLVFAGGDLSWRGERPFVGKALAGRRIGLLEIDDGIWRMRYRQLTIGLLDERGTQVRVRPIPTAKAAACDEQTTTTVAAGEESIVID